MTFIGLWACAIRNVLIVAERGKLMAASTSHDEAGAALGVERGVEQLNPEVVGVVVEFVDLLKSYRVSTVTGDRFGGEWPREAFRKLGVQYELSARPKSDLYRDFLPLVNSQQVELLDLPRSIAQLCSLERRTARGGRDSIDHTPGAHDDIANAIAGLAVHLGGALGYDLNVDWIDGPDTDVAPVDPAAAAHVNGIHFKSEWQRIQFRNHILSAGGTRPWWSIN
jgi:hypothetical protein